MKIGILTYHRTHNYGGCLQALAMRLLLEKLGHVAYFVDYWPKYHQASYDIFSFEKYLRQRGVKAKVKLLLETIKFGRKALRRKRTFECFLNEQVYPYCKPITEAFDIVVYGSDQIWRKQAALNSYNPIYFGGNEIKAKKHIAFSASMGVIPTDDNDKALVANLLGKLDAISVREEQLCDFITDYCHLQATVTLDPTLVVDGIVWRSFVKRTSDYNTYILVYALHDDLNIKSIQQYAKSKGLTVKVLYGDVKKKETSTVINTAGPYEFLSLIYNANMVFTSSFHGLCFSLIYEKEVFVSFSSNSDRAKSLLQLAGIPERFLSPHCDCPQSFKPINYDIINKKIGLKRQDSIYYLKNTCVIK